MKTTFFKELFGKVRRSKFVCYVVGLYYALLLRMRVFQAKRAIREDGKKRFIVRFGKGLRVFTSRELGNLKNTVQRKTGKRVDWKTDPWRQLIIAEVG